MLNDTIARPKRAFQVKTGCCEECAADVAWTTVRKRFCTDCLRGRDRIAAKLRRPQWYAENIEAIRAKAREFQRAKRGGLVLAKVTRKCTACAKAFQPAVHNQARCESCADKSAKPIQCDRCEGTFYRTRGESRARYCTECRPVVRKEKDCKTKARKRRERGEGNLGDTRVCACGTSFIRTAGFQKFCEPCGDAYYRTYHQRPERKKAQAQKRRTPAGAINRRMSSGMRFSLKSGKGGRSWITMVDYTVDELIVHLERQFLPGMTWANLAEIHIDHIVPLAAFKFETPEDPEFKAAWSLSNLRPLWAKDNLQKNAKRTHLL